MLAYVVVLWLQTPQIEDLGLERYFVSNEYENPQSYEPVQPDTEFIGIRTITAYNVGIVEQTDDTPCLDSNQEDVCQALADGEKRCASNEFALGTELLIEDYGQCVVSGRTNKKYSGRIDIAFPTDQIQEAKNFGKQELNVWVVKK